MHRFHPNRLDVWQRNVLWSQAKQLRTMVETELSVDDVFDYLKGDVGSSKFKEGVKRHGKSEKLKQIAAGSIVHPFLVRDRNTATTLHYRQLPLPWYVTI